MRLAAFAYITDGGDRMANGSILIKDTTREERERIVREGLGCGGCAGCDGCDVRGGGSTEEISPVYRGTQGTCRDKCRVASRNCKIILVDKCIAAQTAQNK